MDIFLEVFENFKEFKALFDNLFENKIKALRSKNGVEFTSNEFKDFYKEAGIRRSLPHPIILNRMEWQKERIDLSWKQ